MDMTVFNELCRIIDEKLMVRETLTVAIDGRCGSGKTTLGGMLSEHYGCTLIHMDNFYLRKEQRTPERLAMPGGNVDYERFTAEVIEPLRTRSKFILRPFDHSTFEPGAGFPVVPTKLVIIEGSYSCNCFLRDNYDLKLFLTTDKDTQLRRLEMREGGERLEMFKEKWIPMEEKYFSGDIESICDYTFTT